MYPKIKRLLDIVLAVCILIGVWPFMLIAAIAIKVEDPKGSVIFKQIRVGKDKKPFKIYKFRSMWTETPDVPTHLLSDPNQFITKTGAFLRKTSIDEIPQLVNILRGDMSFKLDVQLFFKTFISVAKSEGVVEGGTGKLSAEEKIEVNEEMGA